MTRLGGILNSLAESAVEVDSAIADIRANKVLWSGMSVMGADETATMSEAISAQPHGVVLVFCSSDSAQYNHAIVEKNAIAAYANRGNGFVIQSPWSIGFKYLYIGDTVISGHSSNSAAKTLAGISYTPQGFYLKYVVGF